MKICGRCKQTLPLTEFCKNKAKKDGLNHMCRSCASAYMKDRYVRKTKDGGARWVKRNSPKARSRLWKSRNEHDVRVRYGNAVADILFSLPDEL